MPLNLDIVDQSPMVRLGVVLHLFYVEMLAEFETYLKNIDSSFDLFITTDSEHKKKLILEHPISRVAANIDVRIVPNRGRDIAPKFIACFDVYQKYDLILLIHSKKSAHSAGLSIWRSFILDHLLGSKVLVQDIIRLFNAFPDLGIVAPRHLELLDGWIEWGSNFNGCKEIGKRMGFELDKSSAVEFPSGSMFWARPQALRPILDIKLDIEEFELEQGQLDGTLAHHIERLFYYSCEIAGLKWLTIARTEMFKDNSKTVKVKHITDIEGLMRKCLLPPHSKLPRN